MVRVGQDVFVRLQNTPSSVRNICIVAHVDHGKTSLSDSLLASNGIISTRLAGKIRYLDARPDEQLRGITMESSAISLYFRVLRPGANEQEPEVHEHLINLIDSPGHIDFANEVSAASRLCDGAVVLVDVVEGVCSQTVTVLRQCWLERIKPILVLNKIDRLISEWQMTPQEAYIHLSKIIEQVNSVIGSFFAGERQLDDYTWREQLEKDATTEYVERDDSQIYFDPKENNVVFASAIDGWGFNISQMAKFYAERLGAKREVLQKVLWGDYYMDSKTKKIVNSANKKSKSAKPLFVSLILDNIWKIYENVLIEKNMEMIEKITTKLGVKLTPRDLRSKDDKQLLKTILGQWLPVSSAVLLTVIEKLPSPIESQRERFDNILGISPDIDKSTLNVDPKLLTGIQECDKDGPLIAYVSKMISIQRDDLPLEHMNGSQEPGSLEHARAQALKAAKRAEMLEKQMAQLEMSKEYSNNIETKEPEISESLYTRAQDTVATPEVDPNFIRKKSQLSSAPSVDDTFKVVTEPAPVMDLGFEYEEEPEDENDGNGMEIEFTPDQLDPNDPLNDLFEYEEEDPFTNANNSSNVPDSAIENEAEGVEDLFDETDEVFIGFARVYSGTLKVGQEIDVLGPKYDLDNPENHITSTTITHLYLFMGKELLPISECPSGNIVGIRGLAGKILKNGVVVGKGVKGLNLAAANINSVPIMRVAVEPSNPMDMGKLARGLKLLYQADPSVQTYVTDSGEHILCTAGELHLERCLKDLKERFACIDITHSEPAIPYRETFIDSSGHSATKNSSQDASKVTIHLGQYKMILRTLPLCKQIVEFLENNESSIRILVNGTRNSSLSSKQNVQMVKSQFLSDFIEVVNVNVENEIYKSTLKQYAPEIAAFGPNKIGCNILASPSGLLGGIFNEDKGNPIFELSDSIVNGFQLAVAEGPLANEPVQGMCVIVDSISIMDQSEIDAIEDPSYQASIADMSGRLITTTKDAIHSSFLTWSPRIMWAMYSCVIQTSVEALGKVYVVVQQRQGKIVSEEMKEGTPFFQIEAHIPVVEAFGFSDDLRKKTSGAAQPQLIFAGFEPIDIDPFWVPTTEEELEELGEIADKENIARRHMNNIRRRKGLFVEEKLVKNAEKQRTLKKD